MSDESKKPDWVPDNIEEQSGFATRIVSGSTQNPANAASQKPNRRRTLSVEEYVDGVLSHDRSVLAKAITLVESNAPAHFEIAQALIQQLMPHTGNSIRIGITGVPGAGKSTFIEALGTMLVDTGHHLAVLAIDPSSKVTRGSILGDKTRMEKLSMHPNAFIRPSPSGGILGGVTRKSRETILVCEAAGFNVILVETVGAGQNEVTVHSMVDFFLPIMITGAGDELQGIKKGVIELADALIINKADGDNKVRAQTAASEYNRALHYLTPSTPGWETRAYTCSAYTGDGIEQIWSVIQEFVSTTKQNGAFEKRRAIQQQEWFHALLDEQIKQLFFEDDAVNNALPQIERLIATQKVSVATAVQEIIKLSRFYTS